MPSVSAILVALSQQLYEDIKFITQHNPTQVVDEDTTKMFNHLLHEVRTNYPFSPQVQSFENMTPRTLKYKDAVVVVGQMSRLLKLLTAPDPRRAGMPMQPDFADGGEEANAGQAAPAPAVAPWTPAGKTPMPVSTRPNPATATAPQPEQVEEASEEPQNGEQKTAPKSSRQIQQNAYNPDPELYGPTPPVHLNEDGTVRFSLDD